MRPPRVNPTAVLLGINRSGTTALAHSLLNHPSVELYKDPGKYKFESTGVADYSHFYAAPRDPAIGVRVVKQSIGQYTPELCTMPIYPMGSDRPAFLRSLKHIFLVRHPRLVWTSWQAMTRWLRTTDDEIIRSHWLKIVKDKGIPVGWGTFGLFRLANLYFYETFEFIRSVCPGSTFVVVHEDLSDRTKAVAVMARLCSALGIQYTAAMIDWELRFGQDCGDRLIDGFNRPLTHPERQYIHRTIRASRGLGVPTRPIDSCDPWPDPAAGVELERRYESMVRTGVD